MRAEFEVHMLNATGKDKAQRIAFIFESALNQLEEVCGKEGREIAIVRTKMEESCFFAKKSMAKLTENQEFPHA